MAEFKCKNCGGILVPQPNDPGTGICDSCFCPGIIPSITSERRADAHNRGIDFRRARKFDEALKEFAAIVKDNPKDAEAHWDMMLCRYGINYQKDHRSGEYIPTCDRLSEVSVYDDPDYKAAIEHSTGDRRTYFKIQAEHVEKIRLGMISLAAKAESYDVFICFKDTIDNTEIRTDDSHLAHELYMELTNKGYKVFFSRVTLKEEHLGQEWEPVIYSALNTAKLMLVVGTSRANIESPWVKNEWTRFLAVRAKDKTKSIITCYDGNTMKISDIPSELGALEAINLRESTFYKYIFQTVFAHCSKQKTVAATPQRKTADNYAMRGLQYLEDGDWNKADSMLEEALNMDPENGEAHVGKFLLKLKCHTVEELEKQPKALSSMNGYSRMMKYAIPTRKNQLMAIDQIIKKRIEEENREKAYLDYVDRFEDIETSEEAAVLASDFERMGSYKDAYTYAQKCRDRSVSLKAEEERIAAERKAREEAEAKRKAEEAAAAAKRKAEMEEAERIAALRRAKAAKHRKLFRTVRRIVYVLILIGVVGYFTVGRGYSNAVKSYNEAEVCMAQGDYKSATELYYEAARMNYKDAEEKGYEACKNWLGWEPVVLSSKDYPWWGVDSDGGLTLDYDKYDEDVEFALPTILDGKLVNGISEGCFQGLDGLKSLGLPANFTWIGADAFRDCVNLNAFSMDAVETIGDGAFYNCDSLTNIALSWNCTSVGVDAFAECSYLNAVTLNEGLTSLGDCAFQSCGSLTSIYIPGTVEYVGASAFAGCYSLNTAAIGAGVKVIGPYAFSGLESLVTVTFGDGLEMISEGAFESSGVSGTLYMPASLREIGPNAFRECWNLYELYTTEGEELTIGDNAFYGCDVFNGAGLAKGLVHLGNSAFDYCEAMTWVSLPEGLTYIGTWCFSNDAIYEVKIPETVTTIGEGAFNNCNNLEGVRVPGGVSVIEANTFAHCDTLWYLWFGEGISIIRDDAVYGSDQLVNICYDGSAESWAGVSVGNNERIINANLYANYSG